MCRGWLAYNLSLLPSYIYDMEPPAVNPELTRINKALISKLAASAAVRAILMLL